MPDKKRIGYVRSLARKTVKDYFKKNPPEILPVPIKEIAENLGFEIYELETMHVDQKAIYTLIPEENRRLIGVNKKYHTHNKRYSIGHEIGHFIIGHPAESECTEEEIKLFNYEADEFSAEILMPLDMLKAKIKEIKDVKKIASLFLVSEQALWIKIKNQNLLNLF